VLLLAILEDEDDDEHEDEFPTLEFSLNLSVACPEAVILI